MACNMWNELISYFTIRNRKCIKTWVPLNWLCCKWKGMKSRPSWLKTISGPIISPIPASQKVEAKKMLSQLIDEQPHVLMRPRVDLWRWILLKLGFEFGPKVNYHQDGAERKSGHNAKNENYEVRHLLAFRVIAPSCSSSTNHVIQTEQEK